MKNFHIDLDCPGSKNSDIIFDLNEADHLNDDEEESSIIVIKKERARNKN